MQVKHIKALGTIAAGGFILAVICTIIYLLELPIFSVGDLSWMLVYGLVSAGVAVFAMIAAGIWDDSR